MRSQKNKALFNLLLGTGAYLFDTMRERASGPVEELRSRAQDGYETASDRFRRATDVLRGQDSHWLAPATAGVLGFGVGLGIGLLVAPASGEQTRNQIAGKARDIRNRMASREGATGTYGA